MKQQIIIFFWLLIVPSLLAQKASIVVSNGTWLRFENNTVIVLDGNLIDSGAITSSQSTLKFYGVLDKQISGNNSPLFWNQLIISDGGDLNIFKEVVINGFLNLQSGIVSGNVPLIFGENIEVVGGSDSSYVFAFIIQQVGGTAKKFKFPFGAEGVYRPITITSNFTGFPTATPSLTGGLINSSARAFGFQLGALDRVSGLRYYRFTSSQNTEVSRIDSFHVALDDEVDNTSMNASLRLATIKSLQTTWIERELSQVPNTLSSNLPILIESEPFAPEALSNSDNFFVSLASLNSDNPLPVELLSFLGRSTTQGIELHWETASETESSGFIIERKRADSLNYSEVAHFKDVIALRSKNSLTGAEYMFNDAIPTEIGERLNYRLSEVSLSGVRTYLQTAEVDSRFDTRIKSYELSQNYPNPFNPITIIPYQIPISSDVRLDLFDVLGRKVATLVQARQEAGAYRYSLNTSLLNLSSGVYFFRLKAGDFTKTKKMLLIK